MRSFARSMPKRNTSKDDDYIISKNRKVAVAAAATGLSMAAVMWAAVTGLDAKPAQTTTHVAVNEPLTLNLTPIKSPDTQIATLSVQ